jgi:hypothetical protein
VAVEIAGQKLVANVLSQRVVEVVLERAVVVPRAGHVQIL